MWPLGQIKDQNSSPKSKEKSLYVFKEWRDRLLDLHNTISSAINWRMDLKENRWMWRDLSGSDFII